MKTNKADDVRRKKEKKRKQKLADERLMKSAAERARKFQEYLKKTSGAR